VTRTLSAPARLLALLLLLAGGTGMAWSAPPQSDQAAPYDGPVVNINSADAATLAEVLTGVGLSRAEAIIDHRETYGAFANVYELANVKGIGERTVELNEPRIVLRD